MEDNKNALSDDYRALFDSLNIEVQDLVETVGFACMPRDTPSSALDGLCLLSLTPAGAVA